VDPIYEVICEEDEEWELGEVVPQARTVLGLIIHFAVSTYLCQKYGGSEESHDWERYSGLFDLQGDLIFEVFRMVDGVLVEDENVGECSKDKVDNAAK